MGQNQNEQATKEAMRDAVREAIIAPPVRPPPYAASHQPEVIDMVDPPQPEEVKEEVKGEE